MGFRLWLIVAFGALAWALKLGTSNTTQPNLHQVARASNPAFSDGQWGWALLFFAVTAISLGFAAMCRYLGSDKRTKSPKSTSH